MFVLIFVKISKLNNVIILFKKKTQNKTGINSVIQHTKMFSQVVPSDQTFESDYAGIQSFENKYDT